LKAEFNKVEDFIEYLRSLGRWSFTMRELLQHFSNSEKALKQSLYRLKSKDKIVLIRSGFYIIIPPEYSRFKTIPIDLYIDDLMTYLGKKYYVGLFTAAGMYGASHQAGMDYYVITETPTIRNITIKNISVKFFIKKQWPLQSLAKRKTDAGYINISSPELTAMDLLNYNNFSINKIATVIEELSDEIKIDSLKEVIRFSNTSTIQRFGYLSDKILAHNRFADVLHAELKKRKVFPIPLLKNYLKKGNTEPQWKIIENTTIETDL